MHGGLLGVAFSPSVRPSVRLSVRPGQILEKESLGKKHISQEPFEKGQGQRSQEVKVKGQGHYKCKRKGRWAHANVKLLY